MKRGVYAIFYVVVKTMSLLPLRALYAIADVMYVAVYYMAAYRKKVVRQNLENAFADKDKKWRRTIEKKYYRHLCDLVVENIWSLRAPAELLRKHCRFTNIEILDEWYAEKKDFVFLLGHTGNWEWSNLSFSTYGKHQLWALYRPIKNKDYDRFFLDFRSRLGARIIPMQSIAREILTPHEQPFGLAFIADQSPVPEYAYWTRFLNQDTGFFNGYEKIAMRKNMPVLFASFKKVKRGFYEITFELMTINAAELKENELTEAFARRLEELIHQEPEHWLWSHKRWKHQRKLT